MKCWRLAQPGERVGIGEPMQRRGRFARARHVADDRDVVRRDAALVEHRRHAQLVPEHRPVLAVVAQRDGDGLAALDRAADALDLRLLAIGALQVAAIPPDELVQAIAGDLLEGVVDIDERASGWLRSATAMPSAAISSARLLIACVRRNRRASVTSTALTTQPSGGRRRPMRVAVMAMSVSRVALAAQADGGAPLPAVRQQFRRGERERREASNAAPAPRPRRSPGCRSKRRRNAALA